MLADGKGGEVGAPRRLALPDIDPARAGGGPLAASGAALVRGVVAGGGRLDDEGELLRQAHQGAKKIALFSAKPRFQSSVRVVGQLPR